MATKTERATKAEYPRLVNNGLCGHLSVEYRWHIYRFMFSDGSTLDVTAIQDTSDLRRLMLEQRGGDLNIVGVAELDGLAPETTGDAADLER